MSEAIENPRDDIVEDPWTLPLEQVDPARGELFRRNLVLPYFARLREEDPVHFHEDSPFGPYWSITSYEHIKHVDMHHQVYSSARGISIFDGNADFRTPMFIAMDPPRHDEQRKAVAPVAGPRNLSALEPEIRRRVCQILDSRGRDIRLGGEGFHRADDPDARDAVRLPLRGALQADALVGCSYQWSGERGGGLRRAAS